MKKVIFLMLLLLITACSSKYKLQKCYILPTGTKGELGLKKCLKGKKICQAKCNKKRENCLLTKEENARKNFPNILTEFVSLQKVYNQEMKRYKSQIKSWNYKYKTLKRDFPKTLSCKKSFNNGYVTYAGDDECSDATQINHQLFILEKQKPYKPILLKPNLLKNIKRLQQECLMNCDCSKKYDSCFISSGGKINHEKIRIEVR